MMRNVVGRFGRHEFRLLLINDLKGIQRRGACIAGNRLLGKTRLAPVYGLRGNEVHFQQSISGKIRHPPASNADQSGRRGAP